MIPVRLTRAELEERAGTEEAAAELEGLVLVRDVGEGRERRIRKGTLLDGEDARRLLELPWEELHLLRPEEGDVPEGDAGERLARAAAGEGTEARGFTAGHWPLHALCRGVLEVRVEALDGVNAHDELAVFTHLDGRVVDTGETVARAKVIPFLIPDAVLRQAGERAGEVGGLVAVRPFRPTRVTALVQESLGEGALERFREALGKKLGWFGSELDGPHLVPPRAEAVAEALQEALEAKPGLILLAGAKSMNPLDPAFEALERLGVTILRHGVPAHPGTLLWLARREDVPIVGVPSCGLFSRATVFDLVLARVLAGLPVDAESLGRMGHGGYLTPEMAWRFPPYREGGPRGEVE